MNESGKYQVFKEKLQGICDENNLTYSIQNRRYPFMLTIKPCTGLDAQMSMMEEMGDNGSAAEGSGTGYISPDASLVFFFTDGSLTYRISETFTISDALFFKIKNLFKKLHDMWMMYFFRDVVEDSTYIPVTPLHDAYGDILEDDVEDYQNQENGVEDDYGPENGDE